MRNLILQIDIPTAETRNMMLGYHGELYNTSRRLFSEYAKKVEADYLCLGYRTLELHPCFERFQLFEERFDVYDHILYVDCDIIPKTTAPNVFKQYENRGLCAFPEGGAFYGNNRDVDSLTEGKRLENLIERRRQKGYIEKEREFLSQEWLENQYFNSGVMLVDQDTRKQARIQGVAPYIQDFGMYDQAAFNKLAYEQQLPFTPLSYVYNGLFHIYPPENMPQAIRSCHFIHYAGPMKNIFFEMTQKLGDFWNLEDLDSTALQQIIVEHAELL